MEYLFPTAEANVVTLMNSINKFILNPIILFLFALAMVYFVWGLIEYLANSENEEARKSGKMHMLWGIFGFFIMFSVFGIMRLILNSIKEDNIKIQPDGSYEVGEMYKERN